MATPFHISTIKSVSRHDEGHYLYLRINLFFPGASLGKTNGHPHPDSTFIKELSFRGSLEKGHNSATNLDLVFRMIKVSILFMYVNELFKFSTLTAVYTL